MVDNLLTRMQKFDIPFWITEYDLTFVPSPKMVETLEEGPLECKPLDYRGRIEEFIPVTITYETPKRYGKAYLEWIEQQSNQQKVQRKSIPFWTIYIGQALLFGLTFVSIDKEWFAPDSIIAWFLPHIGNVAFYVAYLYRLKKIRYWKTAIHILLTFIVLFWVHVFAYTFGATFTDETFLSLFNLLGILCLASPFLYLVVWWHVPISLPASAFHDSSIQEKTTEG